MPAQTTHYQLTKPLADEAYDIEVFNRNADTLDAALKASSDNAAAAMAALPSLKQVYIKTVGVNTFTVPRTTSYIVEVVGGGGGCLSKPATSDVDYGGQCGGGGAYARGVLTLTEGQKVTVTVGAAGAITDVGGSFGGSSSFGTYLTAAGGQANTPLVGYGAPNLPTSGDIRLGGIPALYEYPAPIGGASGMTGYSPYGTPAGFNWLVPGRVSPPATGYGVGAVATHGSTQARADATPGIVVITYTG